MRKYCPDIPCLLVANKVDMDMEVVKKKFLFAHTNSMETMYTSASTGLNVVRVFKKAIELAIIYQKEGKTQLDKDLDELMNDDYWDKEFN
mmetsp:Transcript_7303/g.15494  ORF Transcript_7303/g.15494 Transcript_7303/m.15494 type:complete len:90 (+) Transcript_7303:294-563(+)